VLLFTVTTFYFYYNSSFKKTNNSSNEKISDSRKENPMSTNDSDDDYEMACQNGWNKYTHNVLGISFCYPEKWGEPETSPSQNITNLDGIVDKYGEDNVFYHSIYIEFPSAVGLNLKIFDEQYPGEHYPNSRTHHLGYMDNIPTLKSTRNICDYKIDFNKKWEEESTMNEIYNNCSAGVKEYIMENREFFNFNNIGQKYSYNLRLAGYKRLKNGFFDNLLITHSLGFTGQMDRKITGSDDFFENTKGNVTKDEYGNVRKDFEVFVNSIRAYQPITLEKEAFRDIPGEDPNITTIRKYYWLISTGNLTEAYSMYSDQKSIKFDKFNEWYGDVYFAKPSDIKKVSTGLYGFSVQYQENNKPQTEYQVVMYVNNGKIKTKSSKEILTKTAVFGQNKAYAMRRGDKNYVILEKNGLETVIDQGVAEYTKEYDNIGDVKFFSNVNFSPNGNYITYKMNGWEWHSGYVYDIKNHKIVFTQDSPNSFLFSDDEEYFVSCAASAFSGTFDGLIFNSNNFKKAVFDITKYDEDIVSNFGIGDIECKIGRDVVSFDLNNDNWDGVDKDKYPASKNIKYSLSKNGIIK
jgi:hypothetical protein